MRENHRRGTWSSAIRLDVLSAAAARFTPVFEAAVRLQAEDWSLLEKTSAVTATMENNPNITQ
jgi:hypothetical protein